MRPTALALLALLAACQAPPPEAYVTAAGASGAGEAAGEDARGEPCFAQPGRPIASDLPAVRTREAFCGGWSQPAARVAELRGDTSAATLDRLAAGGAWREALDQRVTCGAPQSVTVAGGAAARLLPCTRRQGGWPHVALVIAGASGPVLADGVSTAMPVIERLATGQAGGSARGSRSAALEVAVQRLSAEAFGAADVGQYEALMRLGEQLNQVENFAAAEDAYRAALALQERLIGEATPDAVNAVMHLALNLSNQGRFAEAAPLFERAGRLAPRAGDAVAPARLLHYRGLDALNRDQPAEAVRLLASAEEAYGRLLAGGLGSGGGLSAASGVVRDPVLETAVLGLAEARRNRGRALARAGRPEEAAPLFAESRDLLRRAGFQPGPVLGRSLRSEATALSAQGREEAAARLLERSAAAFGVATPEERPEAMTLFLAGARRVSLGEEASALPSFRRGAAILRARQLGAPVEHVLAYLDALEAEAARNPAGAAAIRAEQFEAAQLAQRSATARIVQQATARLAAGAADERVAGAVRRLQDAERELRTLLNERDQRGGAAGEADGRIAAAQEARANAEAEVAAAAPGFRQLLAATTTVAAVQAAIAPEEALVKILLGRTHGYALAVRRDRVVVRRIALPEAEASRLVGVLREAIAPGGGAAGPGRFDPAAAHALWRATLAPLADATGDAATLFVVPDGPLLAIPFGLLLTGEARGGDLGAAPWLIRRHGIVHLPSPQSFVTLREAGGASAAPLPYAGFGDALPPSAAQLARFLPADRCGEDARLARGLGRLPGTLAEVRIAGQLMGAAPGQMRFGGEFTAATLRGARLQDARVIHLATHALLPGELSCLPEPALLVSPPPGAAGADASFFRASEVLNLRLDADLVILSACNTGGPAGAGGGEALSGLARAFFYAGARGLMVTHWAVDDTASAFTIADALRRQQAGATSAAALRGAQLAILDEAGKRLPAAYAHPFYWAPFALIGEGRRQAGPVAAARL
jgi:CHAT domain-containing protein